MNFSSLASSDVWRDLIERGRRRTYRSQAVLLAQGESPDGVIALVEGLVKVVQGNEAGDHLTLMLRGPGEVLGERGVLLDRPRSATVTAVRPCIGVVLTAHAFRGYVARHRLEPVVYRLSVDRLNSQERLRADLAHLPPPARPARVVIHLADEVGHRDGGGGVVVELGIPREDLATMAGMSRSSALAVLARLQSAGIVTLGRRRLVVRNPALLRAAAQDAGAEDGDRPPRGTPMM
ncbi:Crp/Fnr family transcriptional regulator [Streptomyces sp. TS71-3]|uniref:Crp/Fnr family transcriptional regulator n=1 Tax=Streptomyces sp. TS71-3 TaxID=2733862 RepID=UPI001B19B22F|nr:Crp/Fnr family transcriptional regulator [Streptomyces sp. TS71-3]GHJ40666.1 Crp/Fnr family transcriptional regulator [Streptomyces sp. TS71-3]